MKQNKISNWLDHLAVTPIRKNLHPKVYDEMKHILENPSTSLTTLDAVKTLTDAIVKYGLKEKRNGKK